MNRVTTGFRYCCLSFTNYFIKVRHSLLTRSKASHALLYLTTLRWSF